jgi:hypothetical protein
MSVFLIFLGRIFALWRQRKTSKNCLRRFFFGGKIEKKRLKFQLDLQKQNCTHQSFCIIGEIQN